MSYYIAVEVVANCRPWQDARRATVCLPGVQPGWRAMTTRGDTPALINTQREGPSGNILMAQQIIQVSSDFWNIRGSFKIGGVVDIKTHASLVRRRDGSFVFLDSCALDQNARTRIASIVGDSGIEAVLNLHPFHTVHVRKMHEMYPEARLYGTVRHHQQFADMPWETERTEDYELHDMYADDFRFSVPEGVDFVSSNENIHFSSVLVIHDGSHTIHVDDTFMYFKLPRILRIVGAGDSVGFHPTLPMALAKRAGAVAEFRAWAESLIKDWEDAENLCAAHTGALLAGTNRGAPIATRLAKALKKVEPLLWIHQRRYG